MILFFLGLIPLVALTLADVPWIHMANVIYLASYSVRDILWLRVLTVVGALVLLPFYFSCSESGPVWSAVAWNGLFIGVNVFQIVLLVRERWPVQLQGIEREVYERVFTAVTPGEFQRLSRQGEWRDVEPGTPLVREGAVVEELLLLCKGEVAVCKGDVEVVRLSSGQFVGEMSFLTQEAASASVVAGAGVKVLAWPQDNLHEYLARNTDLSFKVRGVLGRDLVRKIQAAQPAKGARPPKAPPGGASDQKR